MSPKKVEQIAFHFKVKAFDIPQAQLILWIHSICKQHGYKLDALNIIFLSDKELYTMNVKYLQHKEYTDIITFPYESKHISGDLFISVDRVKDNAKSFKLTFEQELYRVIIHGVLHLLGFKDKTEKDAKIIRKQEDQALEKLKPLLQEQSDHYFNQVYDIVRCIPKGKVTSYGAIADYLALGSARMVGWALNQLNRTEHDIPAHRVLNRKGELSGRLHFGEPNRMEKLLKKDGVKVENETVDMKKYFWSPETLSH